MKTKLPDWYTCDLERFERHYLAAWYGDGDLRPPAEIGEEARSISALQAAAAEESRKHAPKSKHQEFTIS